MEHHETSWNIMKHHETPRNTMKHHATSWNIMKHHETSWNIMKHHATSWNVMKYHETSWNMMKHHEISWNIMKCCIMKHHETSFKCHETSFKYHEISWSKHHSNIRKYHETSWIMKYHESCLISVFSFHNVPNLIRWDLQRCIHSETATGSSYRHGRRLMGATWHQRHLYHLCLHALTVLTMWLCADCPMIHFMANAIACSNARVYISTCSRNIESSCSS